ncbi:MAG TPA: thioesterase family protein [Dongiaceae bacterium]|nr:thioesterase family protein [Dongiaceae bacterium]
MSSNRIRVSRSPARRPFRYQRRIRFGDTDAAGIVYTGRVSDMALEAMEVWFRERLNIDWYDNHRKSSVDAPCVHLEIDFRSPMTPRDILDIAVLLERASGSSLQIRLVARNAIDATLKWQSRFVFACVDMKTFTGRPIPRSWQKLLKRELAVTGTADALDEWTERASKIPPSGARRPGRAVRAARA